MSKHTDNKTIFNEIYTTDFWTGGSGPGSYVENVKEWTSLINAFVKDKNVTSVLDLGCGDGQFLHLLDFNHLSYTGVDVSDVAIAKNKSTEKPANFTFINEDLSTLEYPQVDLILVKDVLQHLPYQAIETILNKIKSSCKYALFCEDFGEEEKDIEAGKYRPINLLSNKFNINVDLFYSYSYELPHKFSRLKKVYAYTNEGDING